MEFPKGLHYTKDHEWVRIEGDIAVVGITDYAQDSLGDIVFVELPQLGTEINIHDILGTVESVKAVSEIYSPISGAVDQINETLNTEPAIINKDPYGEGWIAKLTLKDVSELNQLMNADQYEAFVKEEA